MEVSSQDYSEDSMIGLESGFADEHAYLESADPNLIEYQVLTRKFTCRELIIAWSSVILLLAGYLGCYLLDIPYASITHAHTLYIIFVSINLLAAFYSVISWNKIPSRSLAKDAMLFFSISMVCAAIGNLIDLLFWLTAIAAFKQSVFTNLFFIFAILFALPGIHMLGRVCRVKFSNQPLVYYLAIIAVYLFIPVLMNYNSNFEMNNLNGLKEFVFGLMYAIGIGYMAAVSMHLWKTAQGRLVYSARLISRGTVAMSLGCSIYAGLFPRVPPVEIPSSPVHIIIALGYVFCALGIKRTESTINIIFNLKNTRLPPWLTLVELFGKSEGLEVYRKLEENIRSTLNELVKAKEETQQKQVAISQLEQEINLRKRTERDLIFAKEKAEKANRAKTHFLAMMSHELKTPLTAIKGYGELLKSPAGKELINTDQIESITKQIVNNANDLQTMIDSILSFSQLESGKFSYRKEKFKLEDILDQINSLLSIHLTKSSNNFTQRLPEPELLIFADKLCLQHIIINLLTNACKFCHEGSIRLEIRRSDTKDLYIAVEDSGIGIESSQLDNIFKAFYQISHGTRRKYGGSGLGLSIVKKITEDMNGRIHVESEVDKGTRFEIFLPDVIITNESNENE
jgi:signal transduction histidine kinase